MTAEPLLNEVAQVLSEHRLEAVMVGNAAAALRGAPVTTLDIDFMFRKTAANLKKLKAVAGIFGATIFKQYYPPSNVYRLVNDDLDIRVTFCAHSKDRKSFEKLCSQTTCVVSTSNEISCVKSSLSKDVSRRTMRNIQVDALKKESELALLDQIRRLQALPMNKRTNFLRVRRPGGGSHL